MQNKNEIFITEYDYARIMSIVEGMEGSLSGEQKENIARLKGELQRARKVPQKNVPPDCITMNSTFEVREVGETETRTLTLVYPEKADMQQNRVSILSPVGSALVGYRVGDIVKWKVPAGETEFLIVKIIYQPEAAGEFYE